MLTENHKRGDSIALTEGLLIAARRLSGDGLALSVIACAMPPLPKGEALAPHSGQHKHHQAVVFLLLCQVCGVLTVAFVSSAR